MGEIIVTIIIITISLRSHSWEVVQMGLEPGPVPL